MRPCLAEESSGTSGAQVCKPPPRRHVRQARAELPEFADALAQRCGASD